MSMLTLARFLGHCRAVAATILLVVLTACTSQQVGAPVGGKQPAPKVTISVFQPPSLGAFLPPIIEAKGFATKNNLEIEFVEKPSTTYNTDFAAGTDKVGGSAGLLSEALRVNKGVKVSYLFNVFDYWGTVVTANGDIKDLKGLEGKTLAADKSSTNYAMFTFFAKKGGVDLEKVNIQNASGPALVTMAQADRADAAQVWEPAFTQLVRGSPGKFRELNFAERWEEYTGQKASPYLGVAAHQDWIEANEEVIPRIYATYKDAGDFLRANPDDAANILSEKTKIAAADIAQLIREPHLGLNIYPASQQRNAIERVFQAGAEASYLDKVPAGSIIYDGLR
jgi:ABC-type nitrate/sulfonate/bicarbonate transport system substrate-binding protein